MKYPVWKPVLILAVLAAAALFLTKMGLNKGIDLAGGTVLTYQVNVPDNVNNKAEAIDETIKILSNRVDPSGVMNLIWRRVGTDRIEIQMPLASDEVIENREAYEYQLSQLTQPPVSADGLDRALAAEGDERQSQLAALANGRPDVQAALQQAAEAQDALDNAEAALAQAEADFDETHTALQAAEKALEDHLASQAEADASEGSEAETDADDAAEGALRQAVQQAKDIDRAAYTQLSTQAKAVRQAQADVDEAKRAVLSPPVSRLAMETILAKSTAPGANGAPSARDQALAELKTAHPSLAETIDQTVELYTTWAADKGKLDDPEDLKRLLRGSGVLEFRIAAMPADGINTTEYLSRLKENGPSANPNGEYVWRAIKDMPEWMRGKNTTLDELNAMSDEQVQTYFVNVENLIGARFSEQYYLLLGNTSPTAVTQKDQGWAVTGVMDSQDTNGFPAVSFNLNPIGSRALGRVTGGHVGKPMAILLDGRILSAPRINSKLTNNVQVSGNFSRAEVSYLKQTMKAGSLDATLSENPISEKTVGPTMGQENLEKGLTASTIALVTVSAFMIVYYFFAGAVAVFALVANMLLILGFLAFANATFTLPGIAGLVLTIGMAVDANVLIFERIREELKAGRKLNAAVREGYGKALSTILDANITTLITCVVLGYTASADIKGFAVTLGIGILATLFTALFCTKVILDFYVQAMNGKRLPMLPMAVPAIEKFLEPKVDWLKLRPMFVTISAIIIGLGLTLVSMRGADMLDIEFRSGTAVSFRLASDDDGQAQYMARESVTDLLKQSADIAAKLHDGGSIDAMPAEEQKTAKLIARLTAESKTRFEEAQAEAEQTGLPPQMDAPVDFQLLQSATVVTEGQTEDDAEGNTVATGFSIQTLITDDRALSDLISGLLEGKLRQEPAVAFAGDTEETLTNDAPVHRLSVSRNGQATLADNVEDVAVGGNINVTDFLGGVAIVVDDMSVPMSEDQFEDRIARIRRQGQGANALVPDQIKVVGLKSEGTVKVQAPGPGGKLQTTEQPAYRAFVYLAKSNDINYAQNIDAFTDPGGFADVQWQTVREALVRGSTLDSVTKFSAQVSETMKRQAIWAMFLSLLAVVVYIWLRFGSFRYGMAAILCLVHDVAITLGLIGITHNLMEMPGVGRLFILEDFKIDLAIIAALLTIVGYSLNDTIVIFDRIRENRGRASRATPANINDAINQTISRTLLTSGTTLIALFVLYLLGGPGVHGFAFAMLMGVLIGTYSSIAIAAPLLLWGYKPGSEKAGKAVTKSA